jgi:hypothetical protein
VTAWVFEPEQLLELVLTALLMIRAAGTTTHRLAEAEVDQVLGVAGGRGSVPGRGPGPMA